MFSGLGPAVVSEDSIYYVPGVVSVISAGCNTENRVFLQSCAVRLKLEWCVLRQEPLGTDVQGKPTGRLLQAAIWPFSLI